MRLKRLDLLRFGPFTDHSLDFAAENKPFHLILGLNEAGKSTTLRAVTGLFFGIPETTRDDHVHKKTELRIQGSLEDAAGHTHTVIRRKGRIRTLMDEHDQPIAESVLGLPNGVDQKLYEALFALTHQRLVEGGKDLLAGKGHLGESLFAAGSGARAIHQLRTALREEAERLFTPAAQIKPLNRALKGFSEAKKKVLALACRPQVYQEVEAGLARARQHLAQLRENHAREDTRLNQLKRIARTLPNLRSHEALDAERKALGTMAPLPADCAEQRLKAQHTLQNLARRAQALIDARARLKLEQDIDAAIAPTLLAEEAALDGLRERLSAFRKDRDALPSLSVRVAQAEEDLKTLERELGSCSPSTAIPRLDTPTRIGIQALIKRHASLDSALATARHTHQIAVSGQQACERAGLELPVLPEVAPLKQALNAARQAGDLDGQRQRLHTEVKTLALRADQALGALGLWQGPIEHTDALPLPCTQTVARFDHEFQDLNQRLGTLSTHQSQVETALDQTRGQLETLTRGGVLTPDQVVTERQARDEAWQQLKAHWQTGQAPTPETLSDYERQVSKVDDLADRLWREAERAARYEGLCREQIHLQEAQQHLSDQQDMLDKQRQTLDADWQAQWQAAAITPLPPAEMQPWLNRYERLQAAVSQWRERALELEQLCAEYAWHHERLHQALAALGETPVANDMLTGVIECAQTLLERVAKAEDKHKAHAVELHSTEQSCRTAEANLQTCKAAYDTWRQDWAAAVIPLGLKPDGAVEVVEAVVEQLDQLQQAQAELRQHQAQLAKARAEVDGFTHEVQRLVQACVPALAGLGLTPEQMISRLEGSLEAARRYQQHSADEAEIQHEQRTEQAVLDGLMRQAGCSTLADLQSVEQKVMHAGALDTRLDELRAQLLNEGLSLEDLQREAQAHDIDALPAQIQAQATTLEALNKDIMDLSQTIGRLEAELKAMDHGEAAAEAAEAAEQSLAEITTQVGHYARARLAALILDREIERYRQTHQGPLLKCASRLFRAITLGRYPRLVIDFDTHDEPVLRCERGQDERVAVEDLSEGTRDQLYLALRLAGLSRFFERHEPLPLIFDDILINFDDARARATLELLADLSRRTQILFFTHHQKLLELAKAAVPDELLATHRLDRKIVQKPQGVLFVQ